MQDIAGPEHVADMVTQNGGIDGLGDEVRGTMLIGLRDGVRVVHSREDQNRDAFSSRKRSNAGAGQIPIHVGHHEVQHQKIGIELIEEIYRFAPTGGLTDHHAGRLQRLSDEKPGTGIFVGDQNEGAGLSHDIISG